MLETGPLASKVIHARLVVESLQARLNSRGYEISVLDLRLFQNLCKDLEERGVEVGGR